MALRILNFLLITFNANPLKNKNKNSGAKFDNKKYCNNKNTANEIIIFKLL